MLIGLIEYINSVGSRPIEKFSWNINNSINMRFNCANDSDKLPIIDSKQTRLSFAQNILDNFGFPMERKVD